MRGTFTPEALAQRLQGLRKQHERRARLYTVATILIAVAAGFGSLTLMGYAVTEPWAPLAFLSFPVVMVGLLFWRRASAPTEYDGRRAQALLRMSEEIAPDLGKDGRFEVDLDLRGYARTRKLKVDGVSKRSAHIFRKDWLQLAFRLRDGTQVQLTGTTMVKRKVKRKRKWTKRRERIQDILRVSTRPKGPGGVPDAAPARADGLVKNVDGLWLQAAKRRPRALELVLKTGSATRATRYGTWSVQGAGSLTTGYKLLMAVLVSYWAANPPRRAPD